MATILAILFYALGVFTAYMLIHEWNRGYIQDEQDYQTLFVLSLLSWGAFIPYGITELLNGEENI